MKKWIILVGISLLLTVGISAQTNTILAIQSDDTALQTGQYYTISVVLQDVSELWQLNAEIEYDSTLIYVVGTVSGSPITPGDFFAGEPTLVIRNGVNSGRIVFTHSLLAPANPKSGSGVVATFQIYPLSAGTTQLRFRAADLTKVNFTVDANGDRDVQDTEGLEILPALVELTISGDTVPIPDEATPTPVPTSTPSAIGRGSEATEEPTLRNIVLSTPSPAPLPTLIPELPDHIDNTAIVLPILIIVAGILVIGLVVVVILFISRRSR